MEILVVALRWIHSLPLTPWHRSWWLWFQSFRKNRSCLTKQVPGFFFVWPWLYEVYNLKALKNNKCSVFFILLPGEEWWHLHFQLPSSIPTIQDESVSSLMFLGNLEKNVCQIKVPGVERRVTLNLDWGQTSQNPKLFCLIKTKAWVNTGGQGRN